MDTADPDGLDRLIKLLLENPRVLENIPPDIRIGDIKAKVQELLPKHEDTSIFESNLSPDDGTEDTDEEYTGPHPGAIAQKGYGSGFTPEGESLSMVPSVAYWQQGAFIARVLSTAEGLSPRRIHVVYDHEDESTSIRYRDAETIITVYGEEVYQDLRADLDPGYFAKQYNPREPTGLPTPHPLHGCVDIKASIAALTDLKDRKFLEEFSKKPKFLKLETLFESFYKKLDPTSSFGHRFGENNVYLTYQDQDVVSYLVANVTWPHLKRGPGGVKCKFRRDQKITVKSLVNFHMNQHVGKSSTLGSCYYAPLLECGMDDEYVFHKTSRKKKFDACGVAHKQAPWINPRLPGAYVK